MKCLIIEDDELKLKHLEDFIGAIFPEYEIYCARSYKTGLKLVLQNSPNLILLDMSLPNFDIAPGKDGGRPHSLGGKELFRQIKRRRVETSIIVVTQFPDFDNTTEEITLDQLRKDLENDYPNEYIGAVFYQATSEDWQHYLTTLILSHRDQKK